KVRKGETLRTISSKYGVSVTNIRKWNGLKSNRLATGRKLTVYVDNGGYALTGQTALMAASGETTVSSNTQTAEYGRYKVKPGDSFYSIAKRYPGYTQNDLMKLNNVTNSKLKAGQYIKVPKV
ncbi:MAG: LysM peptidoglycan-binding domain-containing protein, partial [Dysgonamonadaceae bacterium]|nr:LysM peptidoglycan-binding domain-containing protein [Dysgonamonadaceae bacterium]